MQTLDGALAKLKSSILKLPAKKQNILTSWIVSWSYYLEKESSFNPDKLLYYKRGDILYIDFGFNIGNEYGGIHYAAVIENNNNKRNGNIVVIPLTSLASGKTVADIPKTDLYIGDNIIPWTDSATVAKPNQIRTISKMRIVKPVTVNDKIARLDGNQLNLIDERLKQIIFKIDIKS